MEESRLTASRKPNAKDREKLRRFANKAGKRVVMVVGDEEFVFEPEIRDAEGRVLLHE